MAKKNKSLPKEVKVEEKANDFKPLVDENTTQVETEVETREDGTTVTKIETVVIEETDNEDLKEYSQDSGIKNNKYMLTLLDKDLAYIDPHDPNLNTFMKSKVLRECKSNFWYFVREVVRIPDNSVNMAYLHILQSSNLSYKKFGVK